MVEQNVMVFFIKCGIMIADDIVFWVFFIKHKLYKL